MSVSEILAFGYRRNNAELVRDLVDLGYVDLSKPILDPTFGHGRWWNLVQPEFLTACDLDADLSPYGESIDFTSMPFGDEEFDAVMFDPPYKLNGSSHGFANDASYGVGNTKTVSIDDRHRLIFDGMTECARVTGRILVVKCQDQVSSGRVQWQTRLVADHGESLGLRLMDALHVVGYRKQPEGRRQVHARRDYSTALVFTRSS